MTDAEFLMHVLRVAAEDDELDAERLGFAVITAGYTETAGRGPMAGQIVTVPVTYWPFEQGEIVVLGGSEYDREPFGQGRKPSKWDLGCEWFGHDYDGAKRRSDEVKAAPAVDCIRGPGTRL